MPQKRFRPEEIIAKRLKDLERGNADLRRAVSTSRPTSSSSRRRPGETSAPLAST